jgi:quinol monooxygenase YgiN
MITIIAKNIIKPGMAENFKIAARQLVEASRKETGCVSYDLCEDIYDSNILTFIECWKDETAIEKHNQSEHFTRIVPQLGAFRDGSEVNSYRIV